MTAAALPATAEGPYFDELGVGDVFEGAPGVTLTEGLAAAHQAIVGNRLALSLDAGLAARVTGSARRPSPALVWDLAIGQSTTATHHVKANLFYRGLAVRRLPSIGDTLHTRTVVEGLRQNRRREGRHETGLAALHVTTVDQHDRVILDFWRCAMIPLRDPSADTSHRDDLDGIGAAVTAEALTAQVAGWDLGALAGRTPGPHFAALQAGATIEVVGGDVVSSAPELARLTLNVAQVHHDASAAGGRRLVYGGHTIGLALAQTTRALPSVITVTGWHGCDHLGPVHEGDTLRSTVTIEQLDPLPMGGLAHLRTRTCSKDGPVLDWRFVALIA